MRIKTIILLCAIDPYVLILLQSLRLQSIKPLILILCGELIKNLTFINPENSNNNGSLEIISILAQMVTSLLPNVLTAVFPKKRDLASEELCDTLRKEWRLCQTEIFPETTYCPTLFTKRSLQGNKVLIGKKPSIWLG